MIDGEIIIYKNKLDKARTRPVTDKAFDAIQHLSGLKICSSQLIVMDSGKILYILSKHIIRYFVR
jgi:hypothetical protein